jgi:hypothetical protein
MKHEEWGLISHSSICKEKQKKTTEFCQDSATRDQERTWEQEQSTNQNPKAYYGKDNEKMFRILKQM